MWPMSAKISVVTIFNAKRLILGRAPMKRIKLSNVNKYTLVDDKDFEWASKYPWYLANTGYAVFSLYKEEKCKTVCLHRCVLWTPPGKEVDHINLNKLDNRQENLRIATTSQNQANRGRDKNNTSGYKGVYWRKNKRKWEAAIQVNNKRIYLGKFTTIQAASNAYWQAALQYHGAFARKR